MNERDISKAQVKLWLIIALAFLAGAGMVIYADDAPWRWLQKIADGFGSALLIAAMLGLTVDRALKLEIARDVFYAAFQYVLPPELKDEILRIIGYKFICNRHHWLVEIEKSGNGLVRCTSTLRRTMKNIGHGPEKFKLLLHIDEWGYPHEQSKIFECSAKLEDGSVIRSVGRDTSDSTVRFDSEEFTVRSGVSLTVLSKWTEIRNENDVIYLNSSFPTINPEIEIRASDEFSVSRSFGSASEKIEQIGDRAILTGTYLPLHYMVVRWWPKKAS
jgi:hypothetical protein